MATNVDFLKKLNIKYYQTFDKFINKEFEKAGFTNIKTEIPSYTDVIDFEYYTLSCVYKGKKLKFAFSHSGKSFTLIGSIATVGVQISDSTSAEIFVQKFNKLVKK